MNSQSLADIRVRELTDQAERNRRASTALVVESRRIELQSGTVDHTVGAAFEEKDRLDRPDDRHSVFDVAEALQVATRQCGSVGQNRNADRAKRSSGLRIWEGNHLCGLRGNKGDR